MNDASPAERVGVLRYAEPFLRGRLGIPADHRVVDIRFNRFADSVELLIEGPDMPERRPGMEAQRVDLQFTRQDAKIIGAWSHRPEKTFEVER